GKGRIWKIDAPATLGGDARADTQQQLAADFSTNTPAQLQELLSHADMRVRLKAQFELAGRNAAEQLQAAFTSSDNQLARIHGIWGLGQLARKDAAQARALLPLLTDADAEIRAQAAKILGDTAQTAATDQLIPVLNDTNASRRFIAA